jgi:hypothetical protein
LNGSVTELNICSLVSLWQCEAQIYHSFDEETLGIDKNKTTTKNKHKIAYYKILQLDMDNRYKSFNHEVDITYKQFGQFK